MPKPRPPRGQRADEDPCAVDEAEPDDDDTSARYARSAARRAAAICAASCGGRDSADRIACIADCSDNMVACKACGGLDDGGCSVNAYVARAAVCEDGRKASLETWRERRLAAS